MGISKGLNITRESWQVLKSDRKLLVFPLFSVMAATAIVVTIFAAGLLIPSLGRWALVMLEKFGDQPVGEQALGIVCLFALYFVEWFVAIFFNTALVGCALIRFSGGNPTVKDGFRIALNRLPQILGWTLVTAAVGTILSSIEQHLGWLGKLLVRLVGISWAVATCFVVPLLAAEGTGPLTAIRRSVGLLKKTWGEGLTGNFVIQAMSGGVVLLGLVFAVAGVILAVFLESIAIAVLTGVLLVVGVVLLAIVTSAMRQVFLAGLYRYATTGEVPQGFSEASLQQALRRA